MGEPFDINSLSPEDKALFDAMVQEEMMKLEREFKEEVSYPSAAKDDYPAEYPVERPRFESSADDGYHPSYDQRESIYPNEQAGRRAPAPKSPNSLNPQRLAYKGKPEDDSGVDGLNCVGINFGRNEQANSKKARQQEYARQLKADQQQPPRQERSKSALGGKSRHEPEENYVLSTSRSAGDRKKEDTEHPADRRARVNKQMEYARQLESDRLERDRSQREEPRRHRPPQSRHDQQAGSPAQHSSRAGPPSSSRPPFGSDLADPLASTRDIKNEKQREYARQLERDRMTRDRSQKDDLDHQRAPRSNRHHDPEPVKAHGGSILGGDPLGSTRDIKNEKQREYARQLEYDRRMNERSHHDEDVGYKERHLVKRRPTTPPDQRGHDCNTFGSPEKDKAAKRREQEAYAREIREAAERGAIQSPRVSKVAAQRRRESGEDSSTGLLLPGQDVTTAANREQKKRQQEKYRQELASSASAPPIDVPRAPLHSHRGGYSHREESGGIGSAGLIGHHESDQQQRERKREVQRKYAEDLSREQAQRESMAQRDDPRDYRGGGGGGEPYRGGRDRMVSPISYPDSSSYGGDSQYSSQLLPSDTEVELEYLKMLREKAGRQVEFDSEPSYMQQPDRRYEREPSFDQRDRRDPQSDYGYDHHLSPAQAAAAAGGSPYRGQYKPSYPPRSEYEERGGYEDHSPAVRAADPAPRHHAVPNPLNSPRGAAANPLVYEKPSSAQCTGLVIGGMTVLTAAERAEKQRQQQQYAVDLAEARNAKPIESHRESLAERNRYKGNGLPGEYVGQRGASVGGGKSSVVLGGGGSPTHVSPGRMQRRGKQEEYAEQLRLQVEDSQNRKKNNYY